MTTAASSTAPEQHSVALAPAAAEQPHQRRGGSSWQLQNDGRAVPIQRGCLQAQEWYVQQFLQHLYNCDSIGVGKLEIWLRGTHYVVVRIFDFYMIPYAVLFCET